MVSMEVDGDGTVQDNEFVNGDVVVFQDSAYVLLLCCGCVLVCTGYSMTLSECECGR